MRTVKRAVELNRLLQCSNKRYRFAGTEEP